MKYTIGDMLGTILEGLGMLFSVAYLGALLGFGIYMIYLLFFGERRGEAWLSIMEGIIGIFLLGIIMYIAYYVLSYLPPFLYTS